LYLAILAAEKGKKVDVMQKLLETFSGIFYLVLNNTNPGFPLIFNWVDKGNQENDTVFTFLLFLRKSIYLS